MTRRSSLDRSDAIHAASRAADSATNRREAADFEVPSPAIAGRSPSGSRTARLSLRVDTLISIRFMAQRPSQSSACPAVKQKRSNELSTSRQAISRLGTSGSDEGMVLIVMALLSFADSTPRAYGLEAGNASFPNSTAAGAIPRYGPYYLLSATYRDLYAYHSIRRSGKHLQSRQKCGNICRSDRALLCSQSTAIQGNGEELAEFWKRVDVTTPYGKTRRNAPCHHPRKEWSPTR